MTTKNLFEKKIQKGEGVEIRVTVNERNGQPYIDIREWLETPSYSGPTKKGINIHAENWDAFKEAIAELGEYIENNL